MAYYCCMFGLLALCSVAAFVVGLLLMHDQRRSAKGHSSAQAKELALLLLSVLVANVVRVVTAAIVWLQAMHLSGDGASSFPGLVDLMGFTSTAAACAFYLFAFLFPDALPSIVTLVVLVRGVRRHRPERFAVPSESTVPLLESTRQRYEV